MLESTLAPEQEGNVGAPERSQFARSYVCCSQFVVPEFGPFPLLQDIFVKLTEEARRERLRRLDAGGMGKLVRSKAATLEISDSCLYECTRSFDASFSFVAAVYAHVVTGDFGESL